MTSTETYTPPESPAPEAHEDQLGFDDILAMQEANMQRAARRFVDEPNPATSSMELPDHNEPAVEVKKKSKAKTVATVGITLASGAALAAGFAHAAAPDDFSEETQTVTAVPGDTLWNLTENIEGSFNTADAVDSIEADPANIDALKDGLQPGDQIHIPISTQQIEDAKNQG